VGTEKATEASVYKLLAAHVCKGAGNGPTAVIAPGVRSAAGFDARRTIDAVSLGLWPSRGMLLDGYEIKVSRSDWLRELKNPAKAEEFAGLVDRLWLVVSDPEIVKDGELPDNWGLLAVKANGLKLVTQAKRLHGVGEGLPPRFGRSFLVPLLRGANSVPPDVRAELAAEAEKTVKYKLERAESDLAELRGQVEAFEKAAGVKIASERFEWNGATPDERGRAFAAALNGEQSIGEIQKTAARLAESAERLRDQALEIAA
jgi:hypothetical protein